MGTLSYFPNGIFSPLVISPGLTAVGKAAERSGNVFFVEVNGGSDSNDGSSWDRAFATVAKGLAASHADIALTNHWAQRNTVYIRGDYFAEVLTKFADKTDVVGVGTDDGLTSARIYGAQAPTSAYNGTRFFNVCFHNSTGVLVTIPTGASGIGFYNCQFLGGSSTTTAILATASTDLTIQGCNFDGSWDSNFTTAAIDIATGNAPRTRIMYNIISNGNGIGIRVNSGRTGAGSFIAGNFIYASTITIDENSDTFYCLRNYCVSDATAVGTTDPVLALDVPAGKSLQNYLVCANLNQQVPTADTTT